MILTNSDTTRMRIRLAGGALAWLPVLGCFATPDGVGQTTIPQVLGAGEQTPNYRNHLVGVSVRYEFR